MRLRREFITHDTGEESLLVPTAGAGFAGLVRGNATLGAILGQLREDTTEEAIVDALGARYDAPREVIARDVARAIAELRAIGALDE